MSGSPSSLRALATPSVMQLLSIALLSRTIVAILPITLLVSLAQPHGYGIAAVVNGTYVLVLAVLGPLRGRVLDRVGQRRALRIMGPAAIGFMSMVAFSVEYVWPWWTSLLLVLGAGLTAPPFNAAIRASWRQVVPDQQTLKAAHSADSILEEICFVIGPATAGLLIVLMQPRHAYEVTVAAYAIVTIFYLLTARRYGLGQRVAAPAGGQRRQRWLGALGHKPIYLIMVPLVVMGCLFGGVGIYVPAITEAQDQLGWLGPLLAMISIGGVAGGIIYGVVAWNDNLWRKYQLLALGFMVPTSLLFLAEPLWAFGVLLVLSGLFVTPIYINAFLLVDEVIPDHVKHEANIWVGASTNLANGFIAMAIGALATGHQWLAARVLLSAVAVVGLIGVGIWLGASRRNRTAATTGTTTTAAVPAGGQGRQR